MSQLNVKIYGEKEREMTAENAYEPKLCCFIHSVVFFHKNVDALCLWITHGQICCGSRPAFHFIHGTNQSHRALITPALPAGIWHSQTHAWTLKTLNKDAVAKLRPWNAALKMAILPPPVRSCYTLTLSGSCMYANEPGNMWAPFPAEDSVPDTCHELKTTEYHGVLRTGLGTCFACNFHIYPQGHWCWLSFFFFFNAQVEYNTFNFCTKAEWIINELG